MKSLKQAARKQRLKQEAIALRLQAKQDRLSERIDGDPLKQYVRRFGWLVVVRNYVNLRRTHDVTSPIKYLTLPGRNATDIGLLYRSGLLKRDSDGFPNVAICDRDPAVADEVAVNLGRLLCVSPTHLQQALEESTSKLLGSFPFDVINLDLQEPLITGAQTQSKAIRPIEKMIKKIFELQRGKGFLLLLTAIADPSARRWLIKVLRNNLRNQDKLMATYRKRYGDADPGTCITDDVAFTQLVVPKLIGRLARDSGCMCYEHFVGWYERRKTNTEETEETYSLICHSFEIEPLGHREPAKNYEPRISDTNWDILREELSARIQTAAADAYEDFTSSLIEHEPINIVKELSADLLLQQNLKKEAEDLTNWWETHS